MRFQSPLGDMTIRAAVDFTSPTLRALLERLPRRPNVRPPNQVSTTLSQHVLDHPPVGHPGRRFMDVDLKFDSKTFRGRVPSPLHCRLRRNPSRPRASVWRSLSRYLSPFVIPTTRSYSVELAPPAPIELSKQDKKNWFSGRTPRILWARRHTLHAVWRNLGTGFHQPIKIAAHVER